jgi:hypothetical protein
MAIAVAIDGDIQLCVRFGVIKSGSLKKFETPFVVLLAFPFFRMPNILRRRQHFFAKIFDLDVTTGWDDSS